MADRPEVRDLEEAPSPELHGTEDEQYGSAPDSLEADLTEQEMPEPGEPEREAEPGPTEQQGPQGSD